MYLPSHRGGAGRAGRAAGKREREKMREYSNYYAPVASLPRGYFTLSMGVIKRGGEGEHESLAVA